LSTGATGTGPGGFQGCVARRNGCCPSGRGRGQVAQGPHFSKVGVGQMLE